MLLIQSLAFLENNLLFLEKNFVLHKTKARQNKELKYRRKNIVWLHFDILECLFRHDDFCSPYVSTQTLVFFFTLKNA